MTATINEARKQVIKNLGGRQTHPISTATPCQGIERERIRRLICEITRDKIKPRCAPSGKQRTGQNKRKRRPSCDKTVQMLFDCDCTVHACCEMHRKVCRHCTVVWHFKRVTFCIAPFCFLGLSLEFDFR